MDNVSDALIRLKNGYLVGKVEVSVKYSKLVLEICKLLKKHGFISGCKQKDREILVTLKYNDRLPAISNVKRVSKPGLRIYKGAKYLPYILNGLGIAIISTPKGVMSDKEARKLKTGGEVLAEVW